MTFWAISGYTSIFREEQAHASEEDIAFIKQLSRDEGAPASVQAIAGFTLGLLYWLSSQREKSIKTYNRVLKMSITEAERRKTIMGSMAEQTTAGAMFDEFVNEARMNLGHLSGSGMGHPSVYGTGSLPSSRMQPPNVSSGARGLGIRCWQEWQPASHPALRC